MPRLIDSLFNKTASEAVEALAQAYVVAQTKRASTEKKAIELSNDVKNSLIGAAIGGGAGGLGTLGLNYLKGKDLKLNDALYGAVAGALPGAAAGYYQGDNIASAASDVYKAISGKTEKAKDTDKGSGAGGAAGSGSGSTAADNVPKPGSEAASSTVDTAVASLPKPEAKPEAKPAPSSSTAKEKTPSESKTEPMGPPSSLATKQPPHSGNDYDTIAEGGVGVGTGLAAAGVAHLLKNKVINPVTDNLFWNSNPKTPKATLIAEQEFQRIKNEAVAARQPVMGTETPTLKSYLYQNRVNAKADKNPAFDPTAPTSTASNKDINKAVRLAEQGFANKMENLPNKGFPPAVRPEALLGLQSKFLPTKQTANKLSTALLYALGIAGGGYYAPYGGINRLATPPADAPKNP
jgi:hypothetical protein